MSSWLMSQKWYCFLLFFEFTNSKHIHEVHIFQFEVFSILKLNNIEIKTSIGSLWNWKASCTFWTFFCKMHSPCPSPPSLSAYFHGMQYIPYAGEPVSFWLPWSKELMHERDLFIYWMSMLLLLIKNQERMFYKRVWLTASVVTIALHVIVD